MPQILEAAVTGGPLLKGATGRIEITIYKDGEATDATGTPTVTITRADGTALKTDENTTKVSVGVYRYDLTPAECVRVDTLTVALTGTWEGASQTFTHTVEIRGGHLFTIAEARAFRSSDGSTGALNDATTYPASAIVAERDRITDLLEDWTEVSWVPRHHRESVAGSGSQALSLPNYQVNDLIAASIDGVAQTVADITIDEAIGQLLHTTSTWTAGTSTDLFNIDVEYEHGHTGLPSGVTRIALLLLVDRLQKNIIPDRALSYSDALGTTRLVTEGGPRSNVTRIPEVNQWVDEHSRMPLI